MTAELANTLSYAISVVIAILVVFISYLVVQGYRRLGRNAEDNLTVIESAMRNMAQGEREQTGLAGQGDTSRVNLLIKNFVIPPKRLNKEDIKLDERADIYKQLVERSARSGTDMMRFRRCNLDMRSAMVNDLERCRVGAESLPYIGILGTVVGFLFSIFGIGEKANFSTVWAGLILAMSSTAVALLFVLLIKLFESVVLPQCICVENALDSLECEGDKVDAPH